ncbi:MAG: hypothetical protein QM736_03115 [Vicinamibacterales bacterium]
MFAFTVLWAYMSFSQYLIIWSGNLPEEIIWYLHRIQGGWTALGVTLVVVHFALPFFLLLMRGIKRNPELVRKVAMLVIVARVVNLFWLVAPGIEHEGGPISLMGALSWQTIVVPLALFALWLGLYMQQLRQRPLLPVTAIPSSRKRSAPRSRMRRTRERRTRPCPTLIRHTTITRRPAA